MFEVLTISLKLFETVKLIVNISNKLFESFPLVLWRCWLGGRKGIQPVKKMGYGLLVMKICLELELYMSYSSNCHHHLRQL